MVQIKAIPIQKPSETTNVIIGQSHFIKSIEDIYEAIVNCAPQAKFGVAFSEASGACKVRIEGNDPLLKKSAAENAINVGAGHTFIVLLDNAYPINVLNAIKHVPEVCSIYCATANPLEVLVAETRSGRGIMGVVDGSSPKGIEDEADINWRKGLLRKIGYKL